jgi:alpha-L-arabinofuranosidase
LKNRDVYGSKRILMNFYYNPNSEAPLLMEEMNEIQEFMANFDKEVDVIWGIAFDNTLEDQIKVTVLASGFNVSLDKEQTVSVSIDDFKAKTVSGRILTSQKADDYNDFEHPSRVAPKDFKEAKLKKGVLSVKLPAKSLVVLQVR